MSESSRHQPSPALIEQIILALTGVTSARVVVGDGGRLVEIHILATAELHPKQIVRNIESALRAGLGLEIDRRIVSVAQLRQGLFEDLVDGSGAGPGASVSAGEANAAETAPAQTLDGPGHQRLIFLGHEVTIAADRTVTCTVTFRGGSDEFVGRGSGFDTAQGRAEAAARAVFAVLEQYRAPERIGLEGVAIVEIPGRRTVLISARPLGGHRGITLTGTGLLAESPEEAAIMAVLQATNSWRSPG